MARASVAGAHREMPDRNPIVIHAYPPQRSDANRSENKPGNENRTNGPVVNECQSLVDQDTSHFHEQQI